MRPDRGYLESGSDPDRGRIGAGSVLSKPDRSVFHNRFSSVVAGRTYPLKILKGRERKGARWCRGAGVCVEVALGF